jgi:predicted site-specific integrase-resolvase
MQALMKLVAIQQGVRVEESVRWHPYPLLSIRLLDYHYGGTSEGEGENMSESEQVPAAEYLRMSTEDQVYSIENQRAGIRQYADQRGFVVVRSYMDVGRSGVVIKRRAGLRRLLQDVLSESVDYKAILVYDVSRWGRFQDVDESAYYEFICKNSGIPVHYCAEHRDRGKFGGFVLFELIQVA